jgi:hypothetical protein
MTYEGPLRATQGEARLNQLEPMAGHKQTIRKAFHTQLKQLWTVNKFLREHRLSWKGPKPSRPIGDENSYWAENDNKGPMAEVIAESYKEFGYRFVPLVREEISLLCSLQILFLRRDAPGSIITSAGDIDNRIKTLIDGLRRPRNANELVGNETPGPGENPFFCLLEDDKQVTHLEVETDTLLDPVSGATADQSFARVIITVDIRPYYATMFNLSFS